MGRGAGDRAGSDRDEARRGGEPLVRPRRDRLAGCRAESQRRRGDPDRAAPWIERPARGGWQELARAGRGHEPRRGGGGPRTDPGQAAPLGGTRRAREAERGWTRDERYDQLVPPGWVRA